MCWPVRAKRQKFGEFGEGRYITRWGWGPIGKPEEEPGVGSGTSPLLKKKKRKKKVKITATQASCFLWER